MVFVDFVLESLPIKGKFQELERLAGNNMLNYPIGDFLIRIKNASMANLHEVKVQNTKFIKEVSDALKAEGYFDKVSVSGKELVVTLSFKNKKPVINNLRLVSKPGLRVYQTVDDLKSRKTRASVLMLSTPLGILSSHKAVKKVTGGEVLVEIW